MKRLLTLIAVACGAVALYAVTAPAGQQAVTPGQIAALNKKVAALQKDVKNLKTTTNALVACMFGGRSIASSEYNGFQYVQSGGTVVTTTALSLTDLGDTPQYYFLSVPKSCTSVIKPGRAAPARAQAR